MTNNRIGSKRTTGSGTAWLHIYKYTKENSTHNLHINAQNKFKKTLFNVKLFSDFDTWTRFWDCQFRILRYSIKFRFHNTILFIQTIFSFYWLCFWEWFIKFYQKPSICKAANEEDVRDIIFNILTSKYRKINKSIVYFAF